MYIGFVAFNSIANVTNVNVGRHGFLALREVHFEALDHSSYVLVGELVCLKID